MRVLVSGASGFVGSSLVRHLVASGNVVSTLGRESGDLRWSPLSGVGPPKLSNIDAVVHLAGEGVASGLWTPNKRIAIAESRVRGTRLLVDSLRHSSVKTLISASAVGFYGDRKDEVLDEESPKGRGFLADVAESWEAEALRAESFGVRVVILRFGVVLGKSGGMLKRIERVFNFGLGGCLGDGKQYMSWIARSDAVGIIEHALQSSYRGVFNAVAPQEITNSDFTRSLSRHLKRPAFLNVPKFMLRWVLGAMADELLLASQRVVPKRLMIEGYKFKHAGITDALGDS